MAPRRAPWPGDGGRPGPLVAGSLCDCDIDFSQVTITPERGKVVDFTEPYFDANQGLLVHKGIQVAGVGDARKLQAISSMKDDGVRDRLVKKYFADQAAVPQILR